jgi:hypothetical protein
MITRTLDRLAALSGGLYFVLVLLGFQIAVSTTGGWPDTSTPGAAAQHLLANRPTTATWVALGSETTGLVFLLVFGAYLGGQIRRRETATGWMGFCVLGLASATVAVKLGSLAGPLVAMLHPDRYDPSVVAMLFDVNDLAFVITMGLDGVLVLVAAAALLRYDLVARSIAVTGVIAGCLGIASVAVAAADGPLPIPMMVWLPCAGVALLWRGRIDAPQVPVAPRAAPSGLGR